MADNQLTAVTRSEFGKGAARRLRRSGQVPAVLYGREADTVHIALPAQETFLILRQANVLLEIAIDGESKPVMALPKQVTRDPITGFLVHVDLVIVRAGEKVTVEVALVLTGEAERGSMVNQDLTTLTVSAPATAIPEEIEVSIEGMVIGDQILAGDVKLPEGVESLQDPEDMILNITPPPVVELDEPSEDDEAAEEGADEEGADADDAE